MRVLYSSRELIESRSKSALDISATEKKLTEGKTELIKQKDHMKINEQSLQHLNLHSSESQPVLDAKEGTHDPLLRLGLSPGQFKEMAESINLVQTF